MILSNPLIQPCTLFLSLSKTYHLSLYQNVMAALSRESSFERVLSTMDRSYSTNYETIASQNEASHVISSFIKKNNKLKAVYKSINTVDLLHITNSLDSLGSLESEAFVRGQEILAAEDFVKALSNFLNMLPSDPNLKKKNKMARSVRIISSSLLIAKFPGLVLEDDGKPDTSKEARDCHQAAAVFMTSLQRLTRVLTRPTTPLYAFRTALIGYRFSLRCFLVSIDAWKQIDRDRLKHSFEVAYCESYMVIWTSQKLLENLTERLTSCSEEERPSLLRERDENVVFVNSGNTRLSQFRDMLGQLLGPRESRDLLEELDAYLLSSTQAMEVQVMQVGEGEREEGVQEGEVGALSLEEGREGSGTRSGAVPEVSAFSPILHSPASPAASSATSSSAVAPSSEELHLRRVSTMTGMGQNKILHELCLNSKFQLTDPLPPLRPLNIEKDRYVPTPTSLTDTALMNLMQKDPQQGKDLLKKMMIRTIEDRFVANMTQSPVHLVSEVSARPASVYYN